MGNDFIGNRKEQEYFATAYENFLSRLPHLNDAVNRAFTREPALSETVDKLLAKFLCICNDQIRCTYHPPFQPSFYSILERRFWRSKWIGHPWVAKIHDKWPTR